MGCFGEEAGARNLVFFRVKWLQATMKGTSCVRRVRLRSVDRFFLPQCHGGFLWVCLLCVRSSRRVLEAVVADRIGMAA